MDPSVCQHRSLHIFWMVEGKRSKKTEINNLCPWPPILAPEDFLFSQSQSGEFDQPPASNSEHSLH